MATPVFAALLYLGAFPSAGTIALGLLTAFAGYTAVYALNDVVDLRTDREKYRQGHLDGRAGDLDAVLVRHPMAQGLLSLREGLLWTLGWSAVAIAGAYVLNPVCVLIFGIGCLLEAVYCLMLRFSQLRVFVSGIVKTLGAIAAVFAVDPRPGVSFPGALFLCLFFWEIGGQNIPNDWSDLEADSCQGACTLPVRLGAERAAVLIVVFLFLAVVESVILFRFSPAAFTLGHVLAVVAAGTLLLLLPAVTLLRAPRSAGAMRLFNRASYYPAVLLLLVLARLLT
jgi:4-hydroxybenzoate polyprenyltransferase